MGADQIDFLPSGIRLLRCGPRHNRFRLGLDGTHMQRIGVLLLFLLLLTACKQELTKEKIDTLAAVAYIVYGMEEGNNKFNAERVDRKILWDGLEYVVFAKADGPAGMTMRLKSPSECLFTIDTRRDAKGYLETIDFNKATKFWFGTSFWGYVDVEGPQVYCRDDKCEDRQLFMMFGQRGDISLPENQALAIRMVRAINFLKKFCPGKPF